MLNHLENNKMKANPDNYHFVVSDFGTFSVGVKSKCISNSSIVKFLELTIDNQVKFENY